MVVIILFGFAHSFRFFYYHYVCLWANNNMSLDGHNNCVFVSVYVRFSMLVCFIFIYTHDISFSLAVINPLGQCFSLAFIFLGALFSYGNDELLTIYQRFECDESPDECPPNQNTRSQAIFRTMTA